MGAETLPDKLLTAHLMTFVPHAWDGGPAEGVGVKPLHSAELQKKLIPTSCHVQATHIHSTARPLSGAAHGGTSLPRPFQWVKAFHWRSELQSEHLYALNIRRTSVSSKKNKEFFIGKMQHVQLV